VRIRSGNTRSIRDDFSAPNTAKPLRRRRPYRFLSYHELFANVPGWFAEVTGRGDTGTSELFTRVTNKTNASRHYNRIAIIRNNVTYAPSYLFARRYRRHAASYNNNNNNNNNA